MKNQLKSLLVLSLFALIFSACEPEIIIPDPGTTESVLISDNITEDRTLTNLFADVNMPDYIVTRNISVSAVLTVEPGVVIAFESDVRLKIEGAMVAVGTANNKIRFVGKSAIPGFWRGIEFFSIDIRNEMTHCFVMHAGSSMMENYTAPYTSAIGLASWSSDGTVVKLTHNIISESGGFGIAASTWGEFSEFSTNIISNCAHAAIRIPAGTVDKLDHATLMTADNGYNGVEVYASTLNKAVDVTWVDLAQHARYKVVGDLSIQSPLNVAAGAFFEFEPATVLIVETDAYLSAIGAASNKITFTGSVTTAPSWKGLYFKSNDPRNELSHCHISYGGQEIFASYGCRGKGNIGLYNWFDDHATLKMTNCEITNSGGCGVFRAGDAVLDASGNSYSDNVGMEVCS